MWHNPMQLSHHDVKLYARLWCNFETIRLECVVCIACKLGGRFRSDVVEISLIEYILCYVHTICDLLCLITVDWQPISVVSFTNMV